MYRIQDFEYSEDREALYLNDELSAKDLQELKNVSQNKEQVKNLLTTKFKNKVFYKQADYDRMFGDLSWEGYFLSYHKLQEIIQKKLNDLPEDAPHFMIDKSYVAVYRFSVLSSETTPEKTVEKIISLVCNHSF